ncbi:MAG: nucleotidyl transferase AbiEii/AbiGii toxin family protein [Candidatus Omnitrophota bacterium]
MIELLKQQIDSSKSDEEKINRLREAIQLLVLKILYNKGYFSRLAFVGDTALRIIYDMRRFSEDLDFSLISKKDYDFSELISILKREVKLYGLDMNTKDRIVKTVQGSMLKFPGVLKAVGLSALEGENLAIKVEVDSNPPSGWQLKNTYVNKLYVLNITHPDLPSLYATKLHACFFRKYTKGRDFYDLIWYLGKRVKPNYELLNNAIKQTQGEDPGLKESNIKDFLLEKVAKVDFSAVKKDVERFLEDKNELKLLEASLISQSVTDFFTV